MNTNLQDLLRSFESRDGEKIQHVLIGSLEGIEEVTDRLYALHYADVGLWSPIIPMPGTNLWMSVLTRYRALHS